MSAPMATMTRAAAAAVDGYDDGNDDGDEGGDDAGDEPDGDGADDDDG